MYLSDEPIVASHLCAASQAMLILELMIFAFEFCAAGLACFIAINEMTQLCIATFYVALFSPNSFVTCFRNLLQSFIRQSEWQGADLTMRNISLLTREWAGCPLVREMPIGIYALPNVCGVDGIRKEGQANNKELHEVTVCWVVAGDQSVDMP